MASVPTSAPTADPGLCRCSVAVALLALFALGPIPGRGQDVETSAAAGPLRSLLDAWFVDLTTIRGWSEAWNVGDATARRIADDRELDNALLEAEKDRILDESLTLKLQSRVEGADEQQRQAFDAHDLQWQTLEDALVLRLKDRRAMSADATALRHRLDRWRAQTAAAPNADIDIRDASVSALARELAAGTAADADLSLELELARRSVRRLHGGPIRFYPDRTSLVAMLAEIEALEQAAALRASGADARPSPPPKGPPRVSTEREPWHPLLLELTREGVESVRKTVIEYYQSGKSENPAWAPRFIQELEQGAVFLAKERPRIGTGIGKWDFAIARTNMLPRLLEGVGPENGYHGLVLMRPPRMPPRQIEVYHVVHLAEREGVWTVLEDEHWLEEFFEGE